MLEVLGEAATRTFLLAIAVGCSLRILRISQPRLLLAAWTVVLAASIAMPVLPPPALLRVPMDAIIATTIMEDAGGLSAAQPLQVMPEDVRSEALPQDSLLWWLGAFYVVVAVSLGFRVLLGVTLSFRLLARSIPLHAEWASKVRVRVSQDIVAPVTVGHVILVPTDVRGWSPEMRHAVLAHEQAHVGRWDFAMLVLSQLNKALFWFSPVPWWLHRRLVVLCELASDDQAIAETRDPIGYAGVLLEMGRRSGPVFRGPAMARLSTLGSRIDRILLDEPAYRFNRLRQTMVAAAAVGLSLAVASLAPDPDARSVISPLTRSTTLHEPVVLDARSPTTADNQSAEPLDGIKHTLHGDTQTTVGVLHRGQETGLKASLGPATGPTVPPSSPNAPQRLSIAIKEAHHAFPKSGGRVAIVAPSSLSGRSMTRAVADPTSADEGSSVQISGAKVAPLRVTGQRAAADRASDPAQAEYRSTPHQPIQALPTLALRPNIEAVVGSTCTGHIVVGPGARQLTFPHPDVVAGQVVPAQARFFRKDSGAAWVSFAAFGRPPLDVPVRLAQNKATWTGEYGISYAVQAAGDDHLVGLAALVATDSAKLDFSCTGSTPRKL